MKAIIVYYVMFNVVNNYFFLAIILSSIIRLLFMTSLPLWMGLLYIFIHIYLHMAEGYCHYIYETRIRKAMQNKVSSLVLLHVKIPNKTQNSRRIVSTTVGYIYLPYSALYNFTLVVKSGCPVENVPVFKYCYSDSRNLWTVMRAGGLAP